MSAPAPILVEHDGIMVVRDDLFPGGTKARALGLLFDGVDEVAYASPCEGGAQTAIAHVARYLGKRATIFVAERAQPHPRGLMAKALGAKVYQVAPGYLTVVHARARSYCEATGARLLEFGADNPAVIRAVAAAASQIDVDPDEVWCAAGSGVLSRALAAAWPKARRHAVQIGRAVSLADVAGAEIHVHRLPFGRPSSAPVPFPADPHYDAKAWETATAQRGPGRVLFWNVTGPAA